MSITQETNPLQPANENQRVANVGNASNPGPSNDRIKTPEEPGLLNDKAEKYLREVASIEDMPDAQDQQEMDETLERETK